MSDSVRTRISKKIEALYGFDPAGNYQITRFTGEAFKQEMESVRSNEIEASRQTVSLSRTGVKATGAQNFEFSHATYEEDFLAALMDDDAAEAWTAANEIISSGTSIAVDGTLNQYTGAASTFDGFAIGDLVQWAGFTDTENNVICRITAKAGDGSDITVTTAAALVTHVSETVVTGTIPKHITNGTKLRSYHIEKANLDVSGAFEVIEGAVIDQWSLAITIKQIITGVFTYLGSKVTRPGASVSGTPIAATTTEPMQTVDNVPQFWLGDGPAQLKAVTAYTHQLANNLRERIVVGTLGAISLGLGSINLTGTLQAYFESEDLQNAFLNFADQSILLQMGDSNGNYIIDLPRVKFSAGAANSSAKDQDVIDDMSWEATRHPDSLFTIRIYELA